MPLNGAAGGGPRRRRAAPDTLPLPLPDADAGAGSGARLDLEQPMEVAGPFDGAEWRFSIDWEGMRVAVELDAGGEARLRDERGAGVSALAPAVAQALPEALSGRRAVLEGVLAVLDERGRPDLAALFSRAARTGTGGTAAPAGWRAVQGEADPVLLVTDLLALDGQPRLDWSFDRRRETLTEAVTAAPHVQLPAWLEGHGTALCEAAAEQGLPVVAARHGDARYHAGVASPQRLRIAVAPRMDAIVAGVTGTERGGMAGLLLAEIDGGRLVPAGHVEVDDDVVPLVWLRARCDALRAARSPVDGAGETRGVTWLRPSLVATVSHQGRGASGLPRNPALLAVREDRPAERCLRQAPRPVPAGGAAELHGFRPTVIATLPFAEG